MTGLNMNDERCEALFASALQRSDLLSAETIAMAISETIRALGSTGCASRMAQEFGDHPEAAIERMRWARQLLGDVLERAPAPAAAASVSCAA
jgi:hypothetical protein